MEDVLAIVVGLEFLSIACGYREGLQLTSTVYVVNTVVLTISWLSRSFSNWIRCHDRVKQRFPSQAMLSKRTET